MGLVKNGRTTIDTTKSRLEYCTEKVTENLAKTNHHSE